MLPCLPATANPTPQPDPAPPDNRPAGPCRPGRPARPVMPTAWAPRTSALRLSPTWRVRSGVVPAWRSISRKMHGLGLEQPTRAETTMKSKYGANPNCSHSSGKCQPQLERMPSLGHRPAERLQGLEHLREDRVRCSGRGRRRRARRRSSARNVASVMPSFSQMRRSISCPMASSVSIVGSQVASHPRR